MNYTENYSLPQWEDTDVVTREDVNGAMSSIDSAIANASPLVKLYDVTTDAAASTLAVPLTGIDLTQYRYLFLDVEAKGGIYLYLTCNGLTSYTESYFNYGGSTTRSYLAAAEYGLDHLCRLMCLLTPRKAGYLQCLSYWETLYGTWVRGSSAELAWTDLSYFTLRSGQNEQTTATEAGARVLIYGVKA